MVNKPLIHMSLRRHRHSTGSRASTTQKLGIGAERHDTGNLFLNHASKCVTFCAKDWEEPAKAYNTTKETRIKNETKHKPACWLVKQADKAFLGLSRELSRRKFASLETTSVNALPS